MAELRVVRTYFHKYEAEIARGFLNDSGISAVVSADDAGGFHPHLTFSTGNVRLLVHERDFAKAKEILDQMNSSENNHPGPAPPQEGGAETETGQPPLKDPQKKTLTYLLLCVLLILSVLLIGVNLYKFSRRHLITVKYVKHECKDKLVDGVMYSVCTEPYVNGRLRWKTQYQDGKLQGEAVMYHPDGKVAAEMAYEDGLLEGEYREFHPEGTLALEGTYRSGEMEGVFREYFESGELKNEIPYRDGEMHGELVTYYRDGSVAQKVRFDEGQRLDDDGRPVEGNKRLYYGDGQLWQEWHYDNGYANGTAKIYWPNGELKALYPLKDNELNGVSKSFYKNGALKSVEMFRNDEYVRVRKFDKEGNVIYEAVYAQ